MKHFPRPTFPSEFFIVADLSELDHGSICLRLEEVHEAVSKAIQRGDTWTVGRFGEGELGRDVSHDFIPDEPDEEADHRAYVSHQAWERSMAPRVL